MSKIKDYRTAMTALIDKQYHQTKLSKESHRDVLGVNYTDLVGLARAAFVKKFVSHCYKRAMPVVALPLFDNFIAISSAMYGASLHPLQWDILLHISKELEFRPVDSLGKSIPAKVEPYFVPFDGILEVTL